MGLEIEDYRDLDFDGLMELIVEMVNKLGLELFIIDEAQGFLEHDSRKHLYEATECIKTLIFATKECATGAIMRIISLVELAQLLEVNFWAIVVNFRLTEV